MRSGRGRVREHFASEVGSAGVAYDWGSSGEDGVEAWVGVERGRIAK